MRFLIRNLKFELPSLLIKFFYRVLLKIASQRTLPKDRTTTFESGEF